MAAGLGFKDFTTGEVLTAADVDGYLMQGIWVFADSTARDAAVTSPQEGNFAFLKDTNTTTYYTGSAWTNLDTTGMVNPMTTTGDVIYSSSGSTPARLGIGTAGQVLQVNSGATAPEWATPASGGGMTLINTGGTTLSGASVSISSIPQTYKNLQLVLQNVKPATSAQIRVRINGTSSTDYAEISTINTTITFNLTSWTLNNIFNLNTSTANNLYVYDIYDYTNTVTYKLGRATVVGDGPSSTGASLAGLAFNSTAAISSLDFSMPSGNFTSGTAYLYGVK